MSEWWTYSLSDIQSFSLHSYYRLFELYNAAIWPAQIVALALGLGIWALLFRADVRWGRIITAILAGSWLWVAIAFHAHRYSTLTWSARYLAWGFGLEAALLLWTGVVRGRLAFERRAWGLAIFLFALVVAPLIGPLFGRTWRQVEIFGVAPDPKQIRCIHAEGAGCYGHNGADDVALDAALLARQAGAPVMCLWTRADELSWSPFGAAMRVELEGALDEAGTIVEWRHAVWSPPHLARPSFGTGVKLLAAQSLAEPHDPGPPNDAPRPYGTSIEAEAGRVERWLGTDRIVPRFRTPTEQELVA